MGSGAVGMASPQELERGVSFTGGGAIDGGTFSSDVEITGRCDVTDPSLGWELAIESSPRGCDMV